MKARGEGEQRREEKKKRVWDPEVSIRIYLCFYRLCLLAAAECVSSQLMVATISVKLYLNH